MRAAPHAAGHVSDDNNDLMYAGDAPGSPEELDIGGDDYFNANVPGCLDISRSKYLEGNGDPPPAIRAGAATSDPGGAWR